MNNIISINKLIREMDSSELLDYITNIWENDYNQNTIKFLNTQQPIILRCIEAYEQLTGNLILWEISDKFSEEYETFLKHE